MPQLHDRPSLDLSGLKALVTGGTRGIGQAIAQALLAHGATVVVTGRKAISSPEKRLSCLVVDFSRKENVEQFCQIITTMKFDILINNAGINAIGPFDEIPSGVFDRIHDVNVRAPFRITQTLLPHMKSSGWGRIVNISSIFGIVTKTHRASYSTSKFGLRGLTAALAAEVAAQGILANCVAPGFVETDLTRQILTPDQREELSQTVPMKRFAEPKEIASLVLWLSSRDNSYVTGQTFVIDGGYTCV